MKLKTKKDPHRQLLEIAEAQQGFFTTKQAIEAGFAEQNHAYHVHAGNWIREYRGIYRLAYYPLSDEADLVQWALWSRNRQDIPQGVYSHQTALSIHDLSDVMPTKLHLTVPKRFRRNSEIPGILALHRADLPQAAIEARRGFSVTTPLRSIVDLIVEDSASRDILSQATREGVRRGLITGPELKRIAIADDIREALIELYQESVQ